MGNQGWLDPRVDIDRVVNRLSGGILLHSLTFGYMGIHTAAVHYPTASGPKAGWIQVLSDPSINGQKEVPCSTDHIHTSSRVKGCSHGIFLSDFQQPFVS